MQETIAEVVYEAMTQVNVVTDEDRANFREAYGYPVEEHDPGDEGYDEYYVGRVGGADVEVGVVTTVSLGGEVLGHKEDDNTDFASIITQGLLYEGDVSQDDARKVFKIVKDSLDSFPKKRINGKMQNYFMGSPEEFADQVAEKIEAGLSSKGMLGKIASFLKLRK